MVLVWTQHRQQTRQQQQSRERAYPQLPTTLQPSRPAAVAAGSHVRVWQVHMREGLRCTEWLLIVGLSEPEIDHPAPAIK